MLAYVNNKKGKLNFIATRIFQVSKFGDGGSFETEKRTYISIRFFVFDEKIESAHLILIRHNIIQIQAILCVLPLYRWP